jgi:hypothetical protein
MRRWMQLSSSLRGKPYRKVLTSVATDATLHTVGYGLVQRAHAPICFVAFDVTHHAIRMLKPISSNVWHVQHSFVTSGLSLSSRMTVVRLKDSSLWLHSPVPLTAEVKAQLESLGTVRYIVAPSKAHHLFVTQCAAAFPDAQVFGAPGLRHKRPDLSTMRELGRTAEPEWRDELDQIFFDGIPFGNESVWFHKESRTLILTDLCQWWQGDLTLAARIYASLTGVRNRMAVPRTVRWLVKNKPAAEASAQRILEWPFTRVVVAHNAIVEDNAYRLVQDAFAVFAHP